MSSSHATFMYQFIALCFSPTPCSSAACWQSFVLICNVWIPHSVKAPQLIEGEDVDRLDLGVAREWEFGKNVNDLRTGLEKQRDLISVFYSVHHKVCM